MNDRADVAPAGLPARDVGADALERQPLAARGRLKRDPARVPLDRRAAKQSGPERSQRPRVSAVQHDLTYPADRGTARMGVAVAHRLIVPVSVRARQPRLPTTPTTR